MLKFFLVNRNSVKRFFVCKYREKSSRYHIYSIGVHVFHPHGDTINHQNKEEKNRGFDCLYLECPSEIQGKTNCRSSCKLV